MKAILMSIRPQHVVNILNGEKTIEIRKKFPKDYVGWVYIYVTKALPHLAHSIDGDYDIYDGTQWEDDFLDLNGKVIGRFWCDKVEDIRWHKDTAIDLDYYKVVNVIENKEILKASCLQLKELEDYLQIKNAKNIPTTWGITFNLGYAIHITKLEIFDKPKEISEFYKVGYENSVIATKKYILNAMNREERRRYKTEIDLKINNEIAAIKDNYKLTRAPQSWCYIEV